ncbi:WSSV484 [White spot syndrome virus]|uniref:WSSV484 n=1 Tax=White spot syndrome virus TaxID=342409 RepID=A0A2I6SCF1_9VIRU|nr:WSSV484 [White spot syndrome virus]
MIPLLLEKTEKEKELEEWVRTGVKKLAKNIERISSEELKRVTDVQDPKLLHSIMKRTARQIGYDIGDDISPQSAPDRDGSSSSSLLPIRMINIRTEELLEKGGKDTIVRIHILDGILPDNVPLPFKAEIKVDLVDEKYEGEDGVAAAIVVRLYSKLS